MPERLGQLGERLGPLAAAALAAQPVLGERQRALRSASSRSRRLSPRSAARTSTAVPRRSLSASASSSVRSASSGPTTTSGGTVGEAS